MTTFKDSIAVLKKLPKDYAALSHNHISSNITDATNTNTSNMIVKRDSSGNFAANIITASLSGNASTATKLATTKTINGVNFDGSSNITIADSTKLPLTGGTISGQLLISGSLANPLRVIRNGTTNASIEIGHNTATRFLGINSTGELKFGTTIDVNATGNTVWHRGNFNPDSKLNSNANAVSATKLLTPKTVALTGGVTGSASFDGSSNINIATTLTSHKHTIADITNFTGSIPANGGNADTVDGLHANQFGRAYSASYSFGGSDIAITTADFITLLAGLGAFNQPYWVARGSWSYASNKYISDTKIGNIHLAGSTVEVIGNSSAYTIRIHTTTTSTKGVLNTEFVYVNNGSEYLPSWRKIWNDKNDGAGSGLDADLLDGKHASEFANSSHNHTSANISDATNNNTSNMIVKRDGSGNFSANVITASLAGNASTATKLSTISTINGVKFDGSTNIVIADSTKEPVISAGLTTQYYRGDKTWQILNAATVGLGNVTNESKATMFTNPKFTGTVTATTFAGGLTGNASTATKLLAPKTITLTGGITGSASFDGSANININTTIGQHTHTSNNVGLGSVLNYGIASQAEAELGTVDVKYMTPLKVKQAILKLAPDEIIQQSTAPTGIKEGRIWLDTSDNGFQGTAIEDWVNLKNTGGVIGDITIGNNVATNSLLPNKEKYIGSNDKRWEGIKIKNGSIFGSSEDFLIEAIPDKAVVLSTNRTSDKRLGGLVLINSANELCFRPTGATGANKVDLGNQTVPFKDVFVGNFSNKDNGYTKLSNGLIIQWGAIWTSGINAGKSVKGNVTLPLRFPNKGLALVVSAELGRPPSGNNNYLYDAKYYPAGCYFTTPGTFDYKVQAIDYVSGSAVCNFIAIGY